MDCLAKCMHPRISSPGCMQNDPFSNNNPNHFFQCILNRASMLLALKSPEGGSVVGDQETQFHLLDCCLRIEPALQDLDGGRLVDHLALGPAVHTRLLQATCRGDGREALIPENHAG